MVVKLHAISRKTGKVVTGRSVIKLWLHFWLNKNNDHNRKVDWVIID